MKWGTILNPLVLAVLVLGAAPDAGAIDVGWMQPGVRVWYFGGVDTGGVTSSDAEEAYLFNTVAGNIATVVHHSAVSHWETAKPVETKPYPLNDKGPCWIHPQVLQIVTEGDSWMGWEIAKVRRIDYTYATFPPHLLPVKALFDLNAQRQFVELTYMIAGFGTGVAYFDSETGILLYYNVLSAGVTTFFVLAEINYDFAHHAAFAEDRGPHSGFLSFVSESSFNFNLIGGGSVVIQSTVETRYGKQIEMLAQSDYQRGGNDENAVEHYYFDGNIPIVRRIDYSQAGNYPPDQWNPYGQYLWWWLPPTATGNTVANGLDDSAAISTINVLDVAMTKTADQPLTYTATGGAQHFYFTRLYFDADGYMTKFAAAHPLIGLDLKPEDDIFQNLTTVKGRSYYQSNMFRAPASTTTTITSSANPLSYGQNVTLTATVNGTSPTGTVTFDDGASALCSMVPLTVGQAQCVTDVLMVGSHSITAIYSGDVNNAGSTSAALNQGVHKADTSTAISAHTPDPSLLGASIAVTASVTVTPPGGGTPAGTITIGDGSASCPIALPATSCNLTPLGIGLKTLTATYDGNVNYSGSTSPGVSHNVVVATLDVDASSIATRYDALTDGLLVLRYLRGLSGTLLTSGALGATATRTDPTAVKAYLDGIRPALDVDGNGTADALTDGLLIIRYLFGVRGSALISGAFDPLGARTTAPDIEDYLRTLMP